MGREFCLGLYVHFDVLNLVKKSEISHVHSPPSTMMERAIVANKMLKHLENEDEKNGDEKNGDEKNGDEKNGDEKNGDERKEDDNDDDEEDDMNEERRNKELEDTASTNGNDGDDEDANYYTDTDDDDDVNLNKLNVALASSLSLNQIEEIYDGHHTDVNRNNNGSGGSSSSSRSRRRSIVIDSGGSDSDASGDCLNEEELRDVLYKSLKPKFMMKAMADTLLNGKRFSKIIFLF